MSAKILIVEDNPDLRDLWRLWFLMEGYAVVTASDGNDGYQKAESEQPDIILTDINMPNQDGASMISCLRAHPKLHRVPIIALTAYAQDRAEDALRAGADHLMEKPTCPDSLTLTIKEILEKGGKRRGVGARCQ